MLDRSTRVHIERELKQLRRLLDEYEDLLLVQANEPELIERTALSAVLQSFYHGVEGVLQIIAKRIDGTMPVSPDWHRSLLRQMAEKTDRRPAVISAGLLARLEPFLGFRHLARHTYPFLLNWSRMCDLVKELDSVFLMFHQEVQSFLELMNQFGKTPED
jgi:hypothetical protein